jgi:EAL domain-containing protein (putative c-di-GMP-specific phosphodiesterase class I)
VGALLNEHGVEPRRLKIEITESSLMANPGRASDVLGQLRALGVQVAVDDFGTGYSSLAYLKGLPVDELKLDRSFVRDLVRSSADRAIVRSTVSLGHDLGLGVVAEGVEDQPTYELLRHLGCDLAQGYLLARPLSAEQLIAWLAARDDTSTSAAA